MKCPKCDNEMKCVQVADSNQVEVDICNEHGIWLDKGELWDLIKTDRRTRPRQAALKDAVGGQKKSQRLFGMQNRKRTTRSIKNWWFSNVD